MTDAEFWDLIALLGDSPEACDDGPYERLTTVLAARSEDDVLAFADKLAELLFTIDRRDLAMVSPEPLGDDGFLYARCGVIAAGPEAYAAVLADSAAFLPFAVSLGGHADALLEVAPNAYERRTGLEWDHVEPYDFETASNEEGWR